MLIRTDCRFFKGDIPCKYHKQKSIHCEDCKHYHPLSEKVLIIKLGAIGDVIRTTPILRKLKEVYPNSEITWITYFPEVVPSLVDNILKFDFKNILPLLTSHFDILYNFDKDKEACALAKMINADMKKGFTLKDGRCAQMDEHAEHKWLTGLFDDLNKVNTKSYVQEIFEIAGFKFSGEKYILEKPNPTLNLPNLNRPIIGLNTGCGRRWPTRLWPVNKWEELVARLKKNGYSVLLLGGSDEDEKNKRIAAKCLAEYWGTFELKDFIFVVDQTNLVITSVTMALHIAIGLGKKIVLFNNVFNKHEFEMYGLGKIIEPPIECTGCYRDVCDIDCMNKISAEEVFLTVKELLQ
jgi:heptosyltransferase-2